jgi:uncharacterized protein with von Willebrand factor type A (vWA) domain
VLVPFFFELRRAGVPVAITEFLMLLEALRARVAQVSAQDFYYLARACLVKDERHYDRFDLAFATVFRGAERRFAQLLGEVPAEWLRTLTARVFSEEEKQRIADGWVNPLELATGKNDPPANLPAGTTPTMLAAYATVSRVLLNLDETITKE